MKIVRYQDSQGHIGHAQQKDEQYFAIEGDILGDFTVTGREVEVEKLLAPLEPRSIFCIGLNYRRHAAESGAPEPKFPVLFMKGANALQNPGDPILLPTHLASGEVDYECELAVVIGRGPGGKPCKNVPPQDALDYVLGYTAANDVSARDWQRRPDLSGSQWCRGKTFDTFMPLGPALLTPESIPNPNALRIQTLLNGEAVQDWNTDDMIFDVRAIVSFLSGSTTLLPGTVILTGTPHGVGMARTPPLWLKEGDIVEIDIEKIGRLTNPVMNEA